MASNVSKHLKSLEENLLQIRLCLSAICRISCFGRRTLFDVLSDLICGTLGLQVLNAGASICQIYTAMMYGGVGTITRMKQEMKAALERKSAP